MHNLDLASLNARFGLENQLSFELGPNDFPLIQIRNSHSSATLALQGAQLLTWTPDGHQPVVWLSGSARYQAGKSVRGGAPICWPWFGPHQDQPSLPTHGFARTADWEVYSSETLDDHSTAVALRLLTRDDHNPYWPHSTPLELYVAVGRELIMELRTRNLGAAPVTIGQALHTYFAVRDINNVEVLGLEGTRYIDKVDGGQEKLQSRAVTFAGETDRVYLDTESECIIEDPGMSRRIRIGKRGSRSTVVWNPWMEKAAKLGDMGESGYLNMVCVESANAATDVVTLQPGDQHVLAVNYAVETVG